MKGYSVYRYALSYDPPFKERKGLIITILGKGWGEVSPLPGRSTESLEQAQEQLLYALESGKMDNLLPSVAFGLASAQPPLLNASTPLSALLAGSPESIQQKAKEARAQGYTSAKLKISDFDLETAIQVIQSLYGQFYLRIDANRAFSYEEITELCKRCYGPRIEYIEEPTYDLDALEHFAYPFALDESVLEMASLPKSDQFKAVIWKPTVMSQESIVARAQGKKLILSSACETGVGILGIAALASTGDPVGLDTYRFLKRDVLTTPLDFTKGILHFTGPLYVNTALLEEIARG